MIDKELNQSFLKQVMSLDKTKLEQGQVEALLSVLYLEFDY
jgi:hypothetical protein